MVKLLRVRTMRLSLKLRAPFRSAIIAAAVLSGYAMAQSNLTTIQDTLYKADGTRFSGTLNIQWNTFDANNIGTIVQQSKSVVVVNGNLQVQLVPNAGAQAPANVYSVHYQSDGNQQFTETWTVPPSAQPLTVASVRIGTLSGAGRRERPATRRPSRNRRSWGWRPILPFAPSKDPASVPAA